MSNVTNEIIAALAYTQLVNDLRVRENFVAEISSNIQKMLAGIRQCYTKSLSIQSQINKIERRQLDLQVQELEAVVETTGSAYISLMSQIAITSSLEGVISSMIALRGLAANKALIDKYISTLNTLIQEMMVIGIKFREQFETAIKIAVEIDKLSPPSKKE